MKYFTTERPEQTEIFDSVLSVCSVVIPRFS